MNVDHLRSLAVTALEGVADQLAEAEPGRRATPGDRLDVRGIQHVTACPAAVALDGESPFEASPALVAWSLATLAGDRLVHGSADPRRAGPPGTPVEALAQAVEETSDDWAVDWWDAAEAPARSVARAAVVRRVAGVARLASSWPPPGPVTYGHRPSWTFPRRPLVLHGRVDLVLGRRGHGHALVVALGGDHGPTTRARVAYEALVETLALRRAPAKVVAALPDAGRRWTVTVDDTVLEEGVAAAATAARAALGARRRDATGAERRPSPRCRSCAHGAGCDPGTAWLAGPGRLRAGFLPPV